MAGDDFAGALTAVIRQADDAPTAIMCSESLWWRCHRRLVADAAMLCHEAEVAHIFHDGRQSAHRLTEGVRLDAGSGKLVYDVV